MIYDIKKLTEDLETIKDTHYLKELIALKQRNNETALFNESLLNLIDLLHTAEADYSEVEFIPSQTTAESLALHLHSNDSDMPDLIEDIADQGEQKP